MSRWKWTGFLAGLLLAAMTVLPMGKVVAAEDPSPGILMGGEGLKGAGESYVYYGAHGGEPIKTRVLSKEGKQLLVLSEYVLEDVVFDDGTNGRPESSEWEGSMAQKWCKDLYANGFTAEEQGAILATTKTETGISSSGHLPCSLSGDYLYFLSANEATNSAYGFSSSPYTDTAREAMDKNGSRSAWWLRSAFTDNDYIAGAVAVDGTLDYYITDVDGALGGRPAFQINLNSVLFASAAEGGKSSVAAGAAALQPISGNPTDGWKLTVKDGSRNFGISNKEAKTVKAGQTVSLDYTGAKTGNNEYVSAMLMDGNGQAAYYGRMKAVTDASGQVEITVPAGLVVGGYTLQVFNEQYNGDKETDYASEMVRVPVEVVAQENVQPPVEQSVIGGIPGTVPTGEKMTFTANGAGMDNVSPVLGDVRWKPVSWSVNPRGDFADGYTQSFETAGMTPGAHTLTVTYAKEQYDGSAWAATGDRETQSLTFTLLAAPSPGGEEPQAPPSEVGTATPTDVQGGGDNPGTGDSLRIRWLLTAGAGALLAAVMLYRLHQQEKA